MTMPRVHVGAPLSHGALTVFPLWTEHPEDADGNGAYLTGPAADQAKALSVDELPQAEVPQLVATNHGPAPVLLLEGEVLAGGLQTRVLNLSVLVPAMQSLPIPVACVEAGRWSNHGRSQRATVHTPPTLRRHKTASVNRSKATHGARQADQSQVWASVADYEHTLAAPSATSSYADVAHHRRDDVESLTRDLRPLPGQRGMLVGVGGQIVGLELFDRSDTFADYFDSLLAGYAIEALAAEPVATSSSDARRFIRRLASAKWSWSDAVGLGREIAVEGDGVTGLGIAWDAQRPPVHLAAFA